MFSQELMPDDWGTYFFILGVVFLIYVAARFSFWYNDRSPKQRRDDRPGSAIDAAPLTERLQLVKSNYGSKQRADHNSFEKPLLVEQRRQELARMAYFQKPVEMEEPEKHDGLTMILV